LEQSDTLEETKLEQIASALNVTTHTIKNFNDDWAIHHDTFMEQYQGHRFSINPWDKIIELYDALLVCQQEKVDLLKKMLKLE
jgi:hypothetical protein